MQQQHATESRRYERKLDLQNVGFIKEKPCGFIFATHYAHTLSQKFIAFSSDDLWNC